MLLPLFAVLAGCTTTQKIEPVKITYPAFMFQCRDLPSGENVTTDDLVADYIVDLALTAQECKGRLKALGDVFLAPGEAKKEVR